MIGGNLIVGLIIFLVLLAIQFLVITSGAGRVAEVAARFTLDAMPGKQMSIDADLNAGVISEVEARQRRTRISEEADFYGAMDGASKFVRGDAIAALLIVAINIVGGVGIGVVQNGSGIGEALNQFTLLTVGDGLVSQIPALLISTAAGVVITRSAGGGDLSGQIGQQLFGNPRGLMVAGSLLLAMGLTPGLPTAPFFLVGGGIAGLGYYNQQRAGREAVTVAAAARAPASQPERPGVGGLADPAGGDGGGDRLWPDPAGAGLGGGQPAEPDHDHPAADGDGAGLGPADDPDSGQPATAAQHVRDQATGD